MSKILKAASAVAIFASTLATLVLTDATEAFAEQGLVSYLPVEAPVLLVEDIAGDDQVSGSQSDSAVSADDSFFVQPLPKQAEQTEQPSSLRELVAQQSLDAPLDREEKCLAGTVYFEAKGESLIGQLAVAKVVLARRESSRFPDSICDVVYQRSQFSFVRGGRMPAINTSGKAWRNAVAIAQIALDGDWESPVEGALFFHARRVSPGWRLTRIATVDNHVFYR